MSRHLPLIALAALLTGCHAQLDASCARPATAEIAYLTPDPRPATEPPEYVDTPAAPPGEAVPSVDVFYTELSPYGTWSDDAEYGRVFMPAAVDYVPYADGHWAYTAQGFTWCSSEPIGWAVNHYGRWVHRARWIWVPDIVWGPAWVEWRTSGEYVGWAPLPASGFASASYATPAFAWRFAEPRVLFEIDLKSRYLPADRVASVLQTARPIRRYARTPGGAVFPAGPSPDYLRIQHQVVVPVVATREHDMGRMTGQERQEADRRADDRRRAELDRWRIESDRRAADQRAQQARQAQQIAEQQRLAAEQQRRTAMIPAMAPPARSPAIAPPMAPPSPQPMIVPAMAPPIAPPAMSPQPVRVPVIAPPILPQPARVPVPMIAPPAPVRAPPVIAPPAPVRMPSSVLREPTRMEAPFRPAPVHFGNESRSRPMAPSHRR
jgi:hypothetical protein